MICYLDSSALVKRYVDEPGSEEVARRIAEAEAVGTAMVSRVEVVAALAKAVRCGALTFEDADSARREFQRDWPDLVQLRVTEFLVERAAWVAWDQNQRGYDAVQLAAAVTWKQLLKQPVAMVTFDRKLWHAAVEVGLTPRPEDLREFLEVPRPE